MDLSLKWAPWFICSVYEKRQRQWGKKAHTFKHKRETHTDRLHIYRHDHQISDKSTHLECVRTLFEPGRTESKSENGSSSRLAGETMMCVCVFLFSCFIFLLYYLCLLIVGERLSQAFANRQSRHFRSA